LKTSKIDSTFCQHPLTVSRIPAAEPEPPYAVLNSQDFEEESSEDEEGYETIPASERRSMTARKDSNEVLHTTMA
jgi:hypothetical protein